jgi:hypothetical protein
MKISKLPKTSASAKTDLLTIVQGGVTKSISKKDLLGSLESQLASAAAEIKSLKTQLGKRSISKDTPFFNKPVSASDPTASSHLTTKSYVDGELFNVVKNDGTAKLFNNLSYHTHPDAFADTDVVDKKFVDTELKNTLKTIKKDKGDSGYPAASAGECFILETSVDIFATNGPEVQEGDLLICIEDSEGGAHGAVGHQFAIVNTNVVFSTEDSAGILKVAKEEDLVDLDAGDSALTPEKYKRALELGSEYNRTIVVTSTHTLLEEERGIIGVDCRRNAVTLTLPSIGRLNNSKIAKFLIKDEYRNSLKNNIILVTSGGDTIQGSRTYLINSNGASVKLYNDGADKWYLESNVSSSTETGSGVKSFITDDITNGERVTTTGAYESVMSIDVDLREYPIGTGFKVVSHCFAADNSNTKTVAIGIDGTQTLASSLTGTTAPALKFIHHEATVLHSDTAKYFIFGTIHTGADDTAAGLTNNIDLDWNSTIKVSVDVNVGTATDINVYALQVIPYK